MKFSCKFLTFFSMNILVDHPLRDCDRSEGKWLTISDAQVFGFLCVYGLPMEFDAYCLRTLTYRLWTCCGSWTLPQTERGKECFSSCSFSRSLSLSLQRRRQKTFFLKKNSFIWCKLLCACYGFFFFFVRIFRQDWPKTLRPLLYHLKICFIQKKSAFEF